MKITHHGSMNLKDENLSNIEFHKIQDASTPPPRSDSPLIFSTTDKRHFNPLYRQLLASCGPIIATIGAGMVFGYSATLLPELQKFDSEIQITPESGSWIASLCLLPMAIGCLVGGITVEKFGRRKTHMILSVPLLLGWVFIKFAKTLEVLSVGRILGGLSVGLMGPACSLYLSEMSEPKYRGLFLGTPSMALSVGILLIHVIGTFLDWRTTALVACICPVLCYICMLIVPETPSWLLTQGRFEDAAKAFIWLRGCSSEAAQEFQIMNENQKKSQASDTDDIPVWVQFRLNLQKPEFYKPFMIIFIAFLTMQMSGPNTMAFYSVNVMRQTLGASMNEYMAMIAIDLLRAVMSVVACILLKLSKRRTLTIISGIGTVLSLFCLSGYLLLAKKYPEASGFSWLSLLFLVTYIIFISIGIFPLPWCVNGELLNVAMRGFGSSINTAFNFIWCFVVIKTAPSMFENIGMEGTFFFYGVVCLIGTSLLYFFLPETKNKTLHEIEANFARKLKRIDSNISTNSAQDPHFLVSA